jgi:hypothetical protein
MTSGGLDFRLEVLLSIQRALWEMVTPSLRGVAIQPKHPLIRARFIYDIEPTEVEREIVAEVETYVLADFDESIDVNFQADYVPADTPRKLQPGEEWVYLRREPVICTRE